MFPTKILVADDDQIILTTIRNGLEAEGYETLTAIDGESAVRIGCAKKPDLAVLDIRMPGIFGIEVARQLRNRADVSSIFLSAYSDRELVELATKEGALGYLVKPIMIAQLIPAIEAALEQSAELKRLHQNEISLTGAIKSNRTISLAIGIYMERFKVTESQAAEEVRAYARAERSKMFDVAKILVNQQYENNNLISKVREFNKRCQR
ncbi:MAG: response regulator [Chromatiaceae bacterium]|nr:response regulator [Gammaproteobacteria bacterium]MCP5426996.1 response regulator [Chromatiaceae bacterium]MCB1862938.1 response regulator [Gammaproteobacteria bacterium]MCB1870951.1 response regulator [Gammaproteobacteria bacterium]MCB1880828.1 response regulator [Gammaproteobacteria bacterium]